MTLAHGAIYLSLKTTGAVQQRAQRLAGPLAWVAALFVLGFFIWTHVLSNQGVLPNPIQIIAFLLAVGAAWAVRDGYTGWAFAATTAAIAATVVSLFVSLYPNVMVSSTNSAYNLTVANVCLEQLRLDGDDRRGSSYLPRWSWPTRVGATTFSVVGSRRRPPPPPKWSPLRRRYRDSTGSSHVAFCVETATPHRAGRSP